MSEKIDINKIKDLPVKLTVELGRTKMQIRDILKLGDGSIIELDKVVGEPINIFANGKLIAKGEVVSVDERFGVRIQEIITPEKRIEFEKNNKTF